MSESPGIDLEIRGRVAWVTVNRPHRMNALSTASFARLVDIALEIDADDDIRVAVFTGAGDRAFSAGVDLKEMNVAGRMTHPMGGNLRNANEVILEMTKPTIAAINGIAVGGGCELALACDLRIAAETATMGLPEAKVGLGANFASVLLPQLIPRAIAMELLFTGALISAEKAHAIGLVNRVTSQKDLAQVAMSLATQIADNAPLSVQRMKAVASKSQGLPHAAALRLGVGPNPYTSEDRIEGIRAFAEKRRPNFRGI